jgi:hypothetical protein
MKAGQRSGEAGILNKNEAASIDEALPGRLKE